MNVSNIATDLHRKVLLWESKHKRRKCLMENNGRNALSPCLRL